MKKIKELVRLAKFTAISLSAGICQILLFSLLNEILKCYYWVSYLCSLIASIFLNFIINRKVTFKANGNLLKAIFYIILFYIVFIPTSTVLGQCAENSGINEYIVLSITMIMNFILEFLFTRYIVYKNNCDTAVNNKKDLFFNFLTWIIKIFYRKRKIIGIENISSSPAIIVGNHAQIHGPLTCQIYFPAKKLIWCTSEMMDIKKVPTYSYKDFWSKKPKLMRWLYKILSYLIAPFSVYIFTRADTIPVYKDTRLITTFRTTIDGLNSDKKIIIFPECADSYNEIINEFQNKFIDVAKMYYKRTGKIISFYPMYNAANLKTVIIGKPIEYRPDVNIELQREVVCEYLKEEITRLAKQLPKHKVVPYCNIAKRKFPDSK